MDYKHTIDILSENIREMALIVNGFADNQRIPALELDLVLAKTRNLYDVLLLLKKYATDDNKAETDKIIPQAASKQSNNGQDNNIPEADQNIKNDLIDIDSEPVLPPVTAKSDEKSEKKSTGPEILSDRFKKQPSSLHDNLLQSATFYDLSSKLQSKPLSNIAGAIGINERFLFIRELFQDNVEKYNHTIHFLNNAHDFNEAYTYLIENFQWDMSSELVQKILELIRRKFITGKNE